MPDAFAFWPTAVEYERDAVELSPSATEEYPDALLLKPNAEALVPDAVELAPNAEELLPDALLQVMLARTEELNRVTVQQSIYDFVGLPGRIGEITLNAGIVADGERAYRF